MSVWCIDNRSHYDRKTQRGGRREEGGDRHTQLEKQDHADKRERDAQKLLEGCKGNDSDISCYENNNGHTSLIYLKDNKNHNAI